VARQQGLPVFRGYGIRRDELTAEAAEALARTLPPPLFTRTAAPAKGHGTKREGEEQGEEEEF